MTDVGKIVEGLPDVIQELLESAHTISYDELKLKSLDPSTVLLAIIRQGGSGSAHVLTRYGLTEQNIRQVIRGNSDLRKRDKKTKDAWGQRHKNPQPANFSAASVEMLKLLSKTEHHKSKTIYISNTLEAVVLSNSDVVKKIFQSVGLKMSTVRRDLGIGS